MASKNSSIPIHGISRALHTLGIRAATPTGLLRSLLSLSCFAARSILITLSNAHWLLVRLPTTTLNQRPSDETWVFSKRGRLATGETYPHFRRAGLRAHIPRLYLVRGCRTRLEAPPILSQYFRPISSPKFRQSDLTFPT